MTRIISRAAAKARGLRRYFTGKPCEAGHMAERTVKRRDCIECLYARQRRWDAAHMDQISERSRRWYAENTGRAKVTRAKWRLANAEKDRADIAAYQERNAEQIREKRRMRYLLTGS